jgi:hypothetical protein
MLLEPPTPSWKQQAWAFGSALVPALVAAGQLDASAGGTRDLAIVRTVGLGYTGGFRALDTWLAAGFAWVPLGTRTLRAELPGLFLLAATGGLAFLLVRRSLVAVAGASVWSSVVAALATAAATLSYPFQHEAVVPGSSLAGVVLVLAALALSASGPLPLRVALVTLGFTYEVSVGACVLAAVLATRLVTPASPGDGSPRARRLVEHSLSIALGAACGIVPFVLSGLRAPVTAVSTSARLFAAPFGDEVSGGGVRHAAELVVAELGEGMLVVVVVGLAWGLCVRKARRVVIPLVTALATASLAFAEVSGGTRDAWSAAGLVAIVLGLACAAIAMQEAVVRVARAKLPLAAGSAAMVVILEAAYPAVQLDDGLARASARPTHAVSTWEDAAFAGLPGGSLVLASTPRLYSRLLATKASGALPRDFSLIPTFDASNEASAAALAHDPRLVPLFRDLALTRMPEELSMSTLAVERPLAVATDALWDRNLTRHLIPGGLLAEFEPEPRGGADRKRALDDSQPWRARLALSLGTPQDTPLAALTASILFERALAAAETGEREVAIHAIQDATIFAPKDPAIQELTLREASAKGSVDVRDLARQGLAAP